MAFIEPDGSLRNGREIFNKFCSKKDLFIGNINIFEEHTKKVIEKCKLVKNIDERIYNLYVPSGDMKYPAFWVRDALYITESGFIKSEEIKKMVYLISLTQNEKTRKLNYGLIVPAWSIPDHISFDGKPVFFPGTHNTGNDQGNGLCGFYPPHDNQYFFIELAYKYFTLTNDVDFLKDKIKDIMLIDRLKLAFESYNIDKHTQLCYSDKNKYTVDWGFCDSVCKSGLLFFPSLLRYRTALMMREIVEKSGDKEKAKYYAKISKLIKDNLIKTFWDGSGWFLSATEICKQHDVWGTIFAIYNDILDKNKLKISLSTILKGYLEKKCVDKDGYIRPIPNDEDYSKTTSWEKTSSKYQEYQNGGYWAFATGWYIHSLSKIDIKYAKQLTAKFLNHVIANRKYGAPFEWKNDNINKFSGCYYGASSTLPYIIIKEIEK